MPTNIKNYFIFSLITQFKYLILAYFNIDGYWRAFGCSFKIIKLNNNIIKLIPIDFNSEVMVHEKIKVLNNIDLNHNELLFYNHFEEPTSIWRWQGKYYEVFKKFSSDY